MNRPLADTRNRGPAALAEGDIAPQPLTPAQIAFLRLHAMHPAPHAWSWQGGAHPSTWTDLFAERYGRPGEQSSAKIAKAELADLHARMLMREGFHVTEAGLDALRGLGVRF